jgi:hypothetical protein
VDVDLLPSERLLWRGKPARYPLFEAGDRFFAAIWLFVVGCGAVVMIGNDDVPTYFRVAFPAMAVWLVVAKLGLRRLTVRSTEYVLTDQRVVVVTKPFGSRRENSAYLDQIGPPDLIGHDDDRGTITFGKPGVPTWQGARPDPARAIALEWITGAEAVRDLIVEARAGRA